jgi:hypothetical protein
MSDCLVGLVQETLTVDHFLRFEEQGSSLLGTTQCGAVHVKPQRGTPIRERVVDVLAEASLTLGDGPGAGPTT